MKISNTGIEKYESCPRAYKHRYIDKFVSKYKGSALCFGVAVDAGLDYLLNNRNDLKGAIFRFDRKWCKQSDNTRKTVNLRTNPLVTYTKSDFNEEILQKSDYEKNQKRKDNLTWYSLRRKGHLLLKAYQEQILPNLVKIISTQKNISFKNEDSDEIVGIVDVLAELPDGRIALLDNKTTSVKYKEDSVNQSFQLNLYKWILEETENIEITALGYLVLSKKLLKNGKVNTQIVIDSYNDNKIDEIIEKINTVIIKIKNNEFDMNLNSCKTYYGLCDYYKYCHENGNMQDLIDMKEIYVGKKDTQ